MTVNDFAIMLEGLCSLAITGACLAFAPLVATVMFSSVVGFVFFPMLFETLDPAITYLLNDD